MDRVLLYLVAPALASLATLYLLVRLPRRRYGRVPPVQQVLPPDRVALLEEEVATLRQQLAATDERLAQAQRGVSSPQPEPRRGERL